jgi:hypothetical protein
MHLTLRLSPYSGSDGDTETAYDEEGGEPDRVTRSEGVWLENGKIRVCWIDEAGGFEADGVLGYALLNDVFFGGPWIISQRDMVSDAWLALPLVAVGEILAVFALGVFIVLTLLDFG